MMVVDLFGVPVQSVTMDDVLLRVDKSIQTRASLDIGVVNAAKIVNMQKNSDLSSAVLGSDEIYADGMSVVWASKLFGQALPERIAGIDLMHRIMKQGSSRGYRIFCLGASDEVLQKVCDRFAIDYSGVKIVGSMHGYFEVDAEATVAKMIRDAAPDVLFVAITSPKKEKFISRWSKFMGVPVVHGVGGSFDVVAGKTKRAPLFIQQAGFEWLYRVLQEPGRMWRRYLVTNIAFSGLVVKTLWKRRYSD